MMDEETLTALKASIEHWRGNETAQTWEEISLGPKSCALCRKFYGSGCDGCPIKESTGKDGCRGTPYDRAVDAEYRDWDAFKTAAKAEREFLESLLPPDLGEGQK